MDGQFVPPKIEYINLALSRLEKVILDSLDFNKAVQQVVDSMLFELGYLRLGYRIVVLALVDDKDKVLKRVSISQTPEASEGVKGLPVRFDQVEIPLSAVNNFSIKALHQKKPLTTHKWSDILVPATTAEQANTLQEKVGIKTSMVYPLLVRGKPIGIMIFSMIKDEKEVSKYEKELLQRFTDIVAIAVQNSQLYSSLEDITVKLQKANEKLKETDKLKDEFVYVASHELRTPMTAIKNYLWLALHKREESLSPKLREDLERAYTSTERLIRLVQDMLTVSRIEGKRLIFTLESVDLATLWKSAIAELIPIAEQKSIALTLVPYQETCMVSVDKTRIIEVFHNLVGNSLKFTPKGGSITVSLEKTDHTVKTSVTDTGPGIPKEDMSRLFQKFGRLGHSYERAPGETGTGLGLYISKQIVTAHGGTMEVESEVGKGSTFSFNLKLDGEVLKTGQVLEQSIDKAT